MDPEHRLIQERIAKIEKWEALGNPPYPPRFDRSDRIGEVVAEGDRFIEEGGEVRLAGRLMSKRRHGKMGFADLEDDSGRLQLWARKDVLGEEGYERFKLIEVGDFAGACGRITRTRTGELSCELTGLELLSKSLRPLPEKWHGLQDKELRYRQRYVDLIMNRDVREVFVRRARIIQTLRQMLIDEGFLEVETPVLQPIYGGATARPFTTVHHALGDATLYLRIADELYLKRLLVGGYDRVFEIAKDFRNEGIDRTHNPEFTMMECYAAYWDYTDMMDLVERILVRLAHDFGEAGRIRCCASTPARTSAPSIGMRWRPGPKNWAWNPTLAWAKANSWTRSSAKRWSPTSFSRPSSVTIRWNCRRWPSGTETTRSSWNASSPSWAVSKSAIPSPNSTIHVTRGPASRSSCACGRQAMKRPNDSTRISCARSSTACRPRVVWAWASIGS